MFFDRIILGFESYEDARNFEEAVGTQWYAMPEKAEDWPYESKQVALSVSKELGSEQLKHQIRRVMELTNAKVLFEEEEKTIGVVVGFEYEYVGLFRKQVRDWTQAEEFDNFLKSSGVQYELSTLWADDYTRTAKKFSITVNDALRNIGKDAIVEAVRKVHGYIKSSDH